MGVGPQAPGKHCRPDTKWNCLAGVQPPPGSSNLCLPGWDVAPVQVPQGTLERALLISESYRLWAEGFCPRMDSTQNLTHTRVR